MQDDPATDVIGYLRSVQKQLADMEARVSALEAPPKADSQTKEAKAQALQNAQAQIQNVEPKAKDRG